MVFHIASSKHSFCGSAIHRIATMAVVSRSSRQRSDACSRMSAIGRKLASKLTGTIVQGYGNAAGCRFDLVTYSTGQTSAIDSLLARKPGSASCSDEHLIGVPARHSGSNVHDCRGYPASRLFGTGRQYRKCNYQRCVCCLHSVRLSWFAIVRYWAKADLQLRRCRA